MGLVVAATQKLESAIERRLLVSTATLNDKGVFDVFKKRLLKSGEQGLPLTLLLPIFSFLSSHFGMSAFGSKATR